MAGILAAFLIWLFASNKYSDWAALVGINSGGVTGSWANDSTTGNNQQTSSNNSITSPQLASLLDQFGGSSNDSKPPVGSDTGGIWT